MIFNKYLNKSNKILIKIYKIYIKLNLISKLFILFYFGIYYLYF